MTADGGRESITASANHKKHRIIVVLSLLKENTLPHPLTTAVGIFAIHLIFPPFSAAVCCPWRGSKLKPKFLSWSWQAGFLPLTYRTRYHYCSISFWAIKGVCKTLSSCQVVYLFPYWSCFSFFEEQWQSHQIPQVFYVSLCLNLCNAKDLRFAILKSVFCSVIFHLNCCGSIFPALFSCCYPCAVILMPLHL